MKLIAVNTQEKCDTLMRELEAQGYKWPDGKLPSEAAEAWIPFEARTVICTEDGILTHSYREYFEKNYPEVEIIEYEIKKFKVGDRVRHKEFEWEAVVKCVYDNGSFGINDAPYFYYPESCELIESPQKPTVPKCFDDWCTDRNCLPEEHKILELGSDYWDGDLNNELNEWVRKNKRTAIDAILNGYEVEEEPLYYVKLPFVAKHLAYLNLNDTGTAYFSDKEQTKYTRTKFTESEIIAFDEDYWRFAVRVEEDE